MGLLTIRFEITSNSSSELSANGYRFFVDLFLIFDKDNDGVLNENELLTLLEPTPGLPVNSSFPCNQNLTLQGW